ncbi:MAG: hypothetical protein FWE82_10310, partial [Defluviitaleaceae bacterium]|nr:hypothetical protein [Defluviitaleaceae bacterium]
AGPDYFETLINDYQLQNNYFWFANKNYMPVYRPTLELLIDYFLGVDLTISGLATYNPRFSVLDEERVSYLMDFYGSMAETEMIYIPDRWQTFALFNAAFSFLLNSENFGGMKIMPHMLEEIQKLYKNMILNDPDLYLAKQLVESIKNDPNYTWIFADHYNDKNRMEFLLTSEFIKLIFEIAGTKLSYDLHGEIALVRALLTPFSFDVTGGNAENMVTVYYTDKTERLNFKIWEAFFQSDPDIGFIWEIIFAIDGELERYETFNDLMEPIVNAFIDAYVAEHGAEALVPPPAAYYVHIAYIYEKSVMFDVYFSNLYGARLTQNTWDSFWELYKNDFDWMWDILLENETNRNDEFTKMLAPFMEKYLTDMGL